MLTVMSKTRLIIIIISSGQTIILKNATIGEGSRHSTVINSTVNSRIRRVDRNSVSIIIRTNKQIKHIFSFDRCLI